jgi:hypothetical protein
MAHKVIFEGHRFSWDEIDRLAHQRGRRHRPEF